MRGSDRNDGKKIGKCSSPLLSEEEDPRMTNCVREIPWTGQSQPKSPNIINGPQLPKFYSLEYEVKVIHVDNDSYIYIQLCSSQNKEERERLQCSMRSLYQKQRISISYQTMKVGDHMMSVDANGLFRRVKIAQLISEKEISCYEVDHHVFSVANADTIFLMTPEVFKYPIQVIKCELYDMEILTGTTVLQGIFNSLPKQKNPYACEVLINKEIPVIRLGISGSRDNAITNLIRQHLSVACSLPKRIPDFSSVTITHVDNSGCIWFQYIDPLSENILQFTKSFSAENYFLFPKTLQLDVKERLKDKKAVFLASWNEMFYRVQVLSELKDGEVTVAVIDFGEVGTIGLEKLYTIDFVAQNLILIPPRCVKAHLYGIGSLRDVNSFWSQVSQQEEIKVRVIETGKVSEVELILESKECLNRILLDVGEASPFNKGKLPASIPPPTDSSSYSNVQIKNVELRTVNEVKKVIEYDAVLEMKAVNEVIDRKAADESWESECAISGHAMMEENKDIMTKYDEILPVAGLTVRSLEFPRRKTMRALRITDVISNDDFSVQEIENREKLAELERKLTIYYEPLKNTRPPINVRDLVEDGLYAFLSKEMGRWIRARVLQINPGHLQIPCKVLLRRIDYGYWMTETFNDEKDWKNLQPLLAAFCEFPQQGFTASTFGTPIPPTELLLKSLNFNFCIIEREEASDDPDDPRDVPHLCVVFLDPRPDNS